MSNFSIETQNITKILPGPEPVTLVKDINLAASPGELLAITGPSGSGKSSLLYLLGLLDTPTEGEIFLSGLKTSTLKPHDLAHLRLTRLGYVFQFHFLLPEFTSLRNIIIPMQKLGLLRKKEMEQRALFLLESLDLVDCAQKYPSQLSGGQRQRVAIARALANDPSIVLADEPTGNLDSKNGELVFEIFLNLAHRERRTVITVTHDPALASLCDRNIRLVDGLLCPT